MPTIAHAAAVIADSHHGIIGGITSNRGIPLLPRVAGHSTTARTAIGASSARLIATRDPALNLLTQEEVATITNASIAALARQAAPVAMERVQISAKAHAPTARAPTASVLHSATMTRAEAISGATLRGLSGRHAISIGPEIAALRAVLSGNLVSLGEIIALRAVLSGNHAILAMTEIAALRAILSDSLVSLGEIIALNARLSAEIVRITMAHSAILKTRAGRAVRQYSVIALFESGQTSMIANHNTNNPHHNRNSLKETMSVLMLQNLKSVLQQVGHSRAVIPPVSSAINQKNAMSLAYPMAVF
jgi:hypothetical protein